MLLKGGHGGIWRWRSPVLRRGRVEELPALAAPQSNHLAAFEVVRIQLPCFHADPLIVGLRKEGFR